MIMDKNKYIELAYQEIVTKKNLCEKLWNQLLEVHANDYANAEYEYVQKRAIILQGELNNRQSSEEDSHVEDEYEDEWELSTSELDTYSDDEMNKFLQDIDEQKDWVKGKSGNEIFQMAINSTSYNQMRYLLAFLKYKRHVNLNELYKIADSAIRICMEHKKIDH